jgi:uncharacterized membrane protein (GlpM family)
MDLTIKAILGAITVVIIQFFAQSKNYYIAGLVPLFPTFALISHFIVGTSRTTGELKETILFGIFALIPYFFYLLSLYFLVEKFKLVTSLLSATFVWILCATALILLWTKLGNA